MATYKITEFDLVAWCAEMVRTDREACDLAETEMDGEWSGAHTEALCERLGTTPATLDRVTLDRAREAYRAEVAS